MSLSLPHYFIADLPADAELTPALLMEACQTLRRNREAHLASRTTSGMIELLTHVAAEWLNPDYSFRKLALDEGPSKLGFSQPTLASGLDAFFKELTRENFEILLAQDLGHSDRLCQFVQTVPGSRRAALATAPGVFAHVTAGNIPNSALHSMILSLLLRSAQFVKCASGSSLLPKLFAHSIYEADPKIGSCIEVAEWRGAGSKLRQELLKAIFGQVDCVTATGSDEALSAIQSLVPTNVRFVHHGHTVSFAFVAADMLTSATRAKVLSAAGADIVAWDQAGCLSPHVIYVENGGALSPMQFAELLSEELARREALEPRGELAVEMAATIASRRSIYEMRAAASDETRMWASPGSTAWTVIYETDARFQTSCLQRFIYVKRVKDLSEALQAADPVHGKVSTVGIAAPENKAEILAMQLARWGVTRVCPLGQMQRPPLPWRHDGRPALGELVTWTDWEQEP